MNTQQQQKAIEALNKQKEKERKQHYAMMFHLEAFTKLHIDGVFLPYRILYDLEKQKHEGTFTEIEPNPFYPHPAVTKETENSKPNYTGDYKDLKLTDDGLPIFTSNAEYKRQWEEYQRRIAAEKTPIEKWAFWYGRFILPYDLESFSDFDFWGKVPEDSEEKQVVDGLRAACLEAQVDCREHPENYNLEPVLKLVEHKEKYDVDYGYI